MLPYWEVHDLGQGPYMLMVHGFLSSRAQWRINLPALGAFCRPVLLELLGHGRLLPLLEMGEQAGTDEEHGQQNPPHPAAQPEDERADDQRPSRARLRQGAAPVGEKGDEGAEDKADNERR